MVRQNVIIDGILFTNVTPDMVDNDTPWPYVISSNSINTNEYMYRAFAIDYLSDGNAYINLNADEYAQVDFGEDNKKAFSAFRVYGTGGFSCDGVLVTASNDGEEWTTLYSNEEIFYTQGTVYFIENTVAYRYIRIAFKSAVDVNAIEVFTHKAFNGNYRIELKKVLESELPESRQVDNGEDVIYFTDENHIYITPKTGAVQLVSSGNYYDLDNLPDIPEEYILSPATSDTLGGAIIGDGLNVAEDGALSFVGSDYELLNNLPTINENEIKGNIDIGQTRTVISDTQPTDSKVNLWINTNENNVLYAINDGTLIDLVNANGAPIELRRW